MKEYIVSQEYIDGIYTDEGSTFGLDMQKELIRCRDCKWHRENECYEWDDGTVAVISETPDDGFCYRAERREHE